MTPPRTTDTSPLRAPRALRRAGRGACAYARLSVWPALG